MYFRVSFSILHSTPFIYVRRHIHNCYIYFSSMLDRESSSCLSFSEIKDIIEQDHLELLGRSPSRQLEYNNFRSNLLNSWNSISDFLLVSKFGEEEILADNGMRSVVRPLKNTFRIEVLKNDFPYNFEEGIVLLCCIYYSLAITSACIQECIIMSYGNWVALSRMKIFHTH